MEADAAADSEVAPTTRAVKRQEKRGRGVASSYPNCVVIVYAMALAPLRQFGLTKSLLTSLQAISGAGYPGVPSWDILGNVVPFIGGGEEEKIETETNKILGALKDGAVENHPVTVSAAVTRVPVQNGQPRRSRSRLCPDTNAIIAAWNGFRGKPNTTCRRRRSSRSSTWKTTVRSRRSTRTATAA
jgi:aspartate-semialdehyde dehydrogenase